MNQMVRWPTVCLRYKKVMVMSTQLRLLSKATLGLSLACATAFAGTVAPDLNSLSGNTVVQVIVSLNGAQTPSAANMSGVVNLTSLPAAIVAQTTAANAIALSTDPAVSH